MLDKTLPFHTIIMKRPYKAVGEEPILPAGYKLTAYESGLEQAWAEIETAVLEFNLVSDALDCHRWYMPRVNELKKRQWFAESPDGIFAATATAWLTDDGIPVVHALGCRPEFQGKGLGRAVAVKMLQAFYELDKGKDVLLDTQTWSYKAIGLYLSLGFVPLKTEVYNDTPNEYYQALPILKSKMKPELFERFEQSAV